MPTMRGDGGRAMVGYQTAATLGRWRRDGETVSFEVAQTYPFWSDQPITALEVPLGRHLYRWTVTSGTLTGRAVTVGDSSCLGAR